MRVVVAAAGTGGHINPGIAIANKIMEKDPGSKIIFIGTNRGLENDLVPRAGYELKQIESYGISRSLTLKNIKRLFKTIASIGQAKKILKEFKPDIVIGTGGYICVSVLMAAQKLHIPYIIHESNVLPGVATKLLAKKASKVLVGFKEAKERLPKGTKVVVTGTPTKVRKLDFTTEEIEHKKEEYGFDKDLPLVLVFGGSQGALSINNTMIEIIKKRVKEQKNISITSKDNNMRTINLNNQNDYQLMWAPGQKQFDNVKEELAKSMIDVDDIDGVKIVPYIYNMEELLNICDLVVSRSGAMTITEIEKVGKAAIFIPFPYAAENHQEYNARALEKAGCAKVIIDKDLNSQLLDNEIKDLVKDNNTLKNMDKISNSLSINNVEDRIYIEIREAINL